jgi:hypothetical protein
MSGTYYINSKPASQTEFQIIRGQINEAAVQQGIGVVIEESSSSISSKQIYQHLDLNKNKIIDLGDKPKGYSNLKFMSITSILHKYSIKINIVTEQMIDSAANKLGEYIRFRSNILVKIPGFQYWLGPNVDTCYQWRIGKWKYSTLYGSSRQEIALQKTSALKIGSPNMDELSPDFRQLLFLTNYKARQDVALNGNKTVVLKHFPGGDWLEVTEREELYIEGSLSEARQSFLRPFETILKSDNHPGSIMLSHASYEFQNGLKKNYSHSSSLNLDGLNVPASLSPHMIKGLLRQYYGYKGMVTIDWVNMVSIKDFVNKVKKLNPEFENYEYSSVAFIMAVEAGVNWFPGVSVKTEDIENYIQRHPEFEGKLKIQALESLFLKIEIFNIGDGLPFDISILERSDLNSDLSAMSADKRKTLAQFKVIVANMALEARILSITNSEVDITFKNGQRLSSGENSSWLDIWNRNAVLTMVFRKNVVESITGNNWPNPVPRSDERDWLNKLMSDPVFVKAYNSIDWNSKEMNQMYKKAVKKP